MAANGAEAVELCRERAPDVVLMDLEMPVMDGIEATRAIRELSPTIAVLVLTSFADRRRIMGALDAGAVGYLLKDASAEEVVQGIRAAAGGGSPLDPRAAGRCSRRRRHRTRSLGCRPGSRRCSASCSKACRTS